MDTREETEPGHPVDPEAVEPPGAGPALGARLGAAAYAARLEREARVRRERGRGQGRGLFALEVYFNFYAVVRLCLKGCGLWARGLRNYLSPRVEHREVFLESLPPAFEGYRILQLSDLHADLHPAFPDAVRRAVAGLAYDLVVVTGDFRTCTFSDPSGATTATLRIVEALEAPVYAVLGNHDSLAKVRPLEAGGIRFLLNEHVAIERDGARLVLAGIDDPNFYKTHAIRRALARVPEGACTVLLSHSPETHRAAAAAGVDLLLAGHTHGGQICLPGGGVLVHDGTVARQFLVGAWREGRMQGYTSRGTGASGLPVRLNCPGEITIHRLKRGERPPAAP